MHRQTLLKLLNSYQPQDEADAWQRDRIRAFVECNPQCFERSLLEGHVTGSCWLLNAAEDSLLMTHHRKLGRWMQLGGHADGETDVLKVALKEAVEESGISNVTALMPEIFDVDVHEIPARGEVPAHYHYDIRFALLAPEGARFEVSEESNQLAWVRFEDF
ncbi:MAG: NUDIX hydrolase, partial [Deltaproteobacteria bacterium]|nr:NUDIX hydrolase [Deltaproteobacteria bacterium]